MSYTIKTKNTESVIRLSKESLILAPLQMYITLKEQMALYLKSTKRVKNNLNQSWSIL